MEIQNDRPYACNLCDYRAKLKQHLETHIVRHGPKLPCDRCHREFRLQKTLDKHRSTEHKYLDPNDPRYEKHEIDIQWWRTQMQKHKYDATQPKPFQCPICDQWLRTKVGLSFHIKTHRDIREYPCTWEGCMESFTQSGSLETHRRRHANMKPFQCNVANCGKSFVEKRHYQDHVRVHDKSTYPYTCKECPMRFNTKSNLRSHMHKHNQDRPYKFPCLSDACDKMFQYKCVRRDHVSKIHGFPWRFKCTFCPFYQTNSATTIKKHHKSHHSPEGIKIRKKKEHHFGTWLASNGFDQVVRNQRVSFKCKEKEATWIELDYYIHRHSDDTVFIVELDEHQHEGYAQGCESLRPFKVIEGLAEELNGRSVVFVRISPDDFRVDGVKQKVSVKTRYETFKKFYDTLETPSRGLTVQYMFYDVTADGTLEIETDPEFAQMIKDVMLPPIYKA